MDESQILTKFSIKELNIPTGLQAQIEHEYRNRIMDILGKSGLPVNTPPLEMGPSDLLLGRARLQEKVGYIYPNLHMKMMINLHRSEVVPYHENDFDILVVHYPEPYQRQFCFIPMWELVNHGLVSTSQSSGKTALYVYIDKDHVENIWGWIDKYSLHYDQPDLNNQILSIYNSAINPPVAPVTETEQYVIGLSSVSGIFQAVCNELDHQIRPRIANCHIATRVVDYYAILLKECVTRSGQGIIEAIPESQGV